MRLGWLVAPVVDVLARDRAPVVPEVEVPEVGLRWGRSSQFEFGMRHRPGPEDPPAILIGRGRPRVIEGVETHRQYSEESPVPEAPALVVEGVRSTTFFIGERVTQSESRKVEGGVTLVEPTVETIEEYIRFDFEFTFVGQRGAEPPQPPTGQPRPAPAFRIPDSVDLSPFRTIVGIDTPEEAVLVLWSLTARANTALTGGSHLDGSYATEAEALAAAQSAIDNHWAEIRQGTVDGYAQVTDATDPVAFAHSQNGVSWLPYVICRVTIEDTFVQPSDWVHPPLGDLEAWKDLGFIDLSPVDEQAALTLPDPGLFGDGQYPFHATELQSVTQA